MPNSNDSTDQGWRTSAFTDFLEAWEKAIIAYEEAQFGSEKQAAHKIAALLRSGVEKLLKLDEFASQSREPFDRLEKRMADVLKPRRV